MRQTLRDYQQTGVRKIIDGFRQGARSQLIVLPTAGGKTSIFTFITSQTKAPVLILVHRRELAEQASNRLREFGVDFGLIMSGEAPKPYARVQVASVQTLVRRIKAGRFPPAGLVIADEAHLSTAATWQTILECYPRARILGFTATPWRLSGKPLAAQYDRASVISTPRELCEASYLAPYAGFSYLAPDLSNVGTVADEYNRKESAEAMRQPSIVANIVEKWQAHASELSTVVFAVTVEHSRQVCGEFRAVGVAAEHLDGTTPLEQRRAILRRVESGQTRVLCNVGVAVEGLDIPRLKCCVDANPTKSLARAIQKWGRVRRPWNGVKARIHDHAFNIRLHGLPDADRDYSLDATPEEPPSLSTCEECRAIYFGPRCPACEHVNEVEISERRELVTVADAESFEFDSSTVAAIAALEGVELAPEDLPAVDVRWETPGRVLEGRYTATTTETTSFGPLKVYVLTGAKRKYRLPGTKHLNDCMHPRRIGETLRVTYLGPLQGSRKKLFQVEVDDDA